MDLPDRLQNRLQNRSGTLMNRDRYLKTAVLIPLVRRGDDNEAGWRIMFERRADHLDHQPGDVCFPGGRSEDQDDTLRDTAVRETCEEFGLAKRDVTVLGNLDYLATPWRVIIDPFVGVIRSSARIRPEESEVDEVFEVSLQAALDADPDVHRVELVPRPPDDFPYEKIAGGRDYEWHPGDLPEYFFDFDGRVIWGLTGRILDHFLSVIRESFTNPD